MILVSYFKLLWLHTGITMDPTFPAMCATGDCPTHDRICRANWPWSHCRLRRFQWKKGPWLYRVYVGDIITGPCWKLGICFFGSIYHWLGPTWWFQIFLSFTPGERIQFDEHILQMGWKRDHFLLASFLLNHIGWKHTCRPGMVFRWHDIKLTKDKQWRVVTLPETNIAPENRPSQSESSIPTIHF